MKKLRSFLNFDTERFFTGKELRVVGAEPWQEYTNTGPGKIIGTRYKLVIATDKTVYDAKDPEKDARINEGEPLVVKVAKPQKGFGKFAIAKLVEPKATIYGQFQNELSVIAEDILFESNMKKEA